MGSGGGSTNTVDPVYNAGLLELSQEQQGWAREAWNMYKFGTTYDPSEKVTGYYDQSGKFIEGTPGQTPNPDYVPATYKTSQGSGRGDSWDPLGSGDRVLDQPAQGEQFLNTGPAGENYITLTRGEIEGYNADDQTSEMDYLQNVVNANQSLLGLQTETAEKQLNLKSSLLDEISTGVDIPGRMDEAQAGVQHGFKLARKASDMNLGSFGLDPNSGKFASSNRGLVLDEAKSIAGARTQAKRYGEAEDFSRKVQGLQI